MPSSDFPHDPSSQLATKPYATEHQNAYIQVDDLEGSVTFNIHHGMLNASFHLTDQEWDDLAELVAEKRAQRHASRPTTC